MEKPTKKKTSEEEGVINIGEIKGISGGTINIAGGDIQQHNVHTIETGGGAYIAGNINTGGGDFVGRDKIVNNGVQAAEVMRLFEQIFNRIDAKTDLEAVDKADLKEEVKAIQVEATKTADVDENALSRSLRNIKRMAPDILDVVLATLTGPAAGISMVAKKIAEKMKAAAA